MSDAKTIEIKNDQIRELEDILFFQRRLLEEWKQICSEQEQSMKYMRNHIADMQVKLSGYRQFYEKKGGEC